MIGFRNKSEPFCDDKDNAALHQLPQHMLAVVMVVVMVVVVTMLILTLFVMTAATANHRPPALPLVLMLMLMPARAVVILVFAMSSRTFLSMRRVIATAAIVML